MYSIGKLAETCNVSVRTLRYYDEVDLLKPSKVGVGGHRFYNNEALVKLHLIFLLSIVIKKPLALYFAVDFAFLQGYPRADNKRLFTRKSLFCWFQLLTMIFVIRGLFQSGLKAWLIHSYGIEAYNELPIYMNVSGWIFSGLIMHLSR